MPLRSDKRRTTVPEARVNRRESGYTLIELLIVMVVLAVIAAIALTSIWNALDRAKQRATMADMRTISKALELYQSDHGYIPSAAGGMTTLKGVLVPYQTSVVPVVDHWGHGYVYTAATTGKGYTIESYGKDGINGTNISMSTRSQFNADILLSDGLFVASPE